MTRSFKLLNIILLLSGLSISCSQLPQPEMKSQNISEKAILVRQTAQVVREDFSVASDPNIQLFVREVRVNNVNSDRDPFFCYMEVVQAELLRLMSKFLVIRLPKTLLKLDIQFIS
jgi:hypothetical protein